MTHRRCATWLCGLLALGLLLPACGKYGKPHRLQRPPPAEAAEARIGDEQADDFDPDDPEDRMPDSTLDAEEMEP